ncbi:MAG TPA: CsbD family protein [Steroidobacteraceae bacterium]|nr:CsbD family protein [Steroidobacteraceae bacterium]
MNCDRVKGNWKQLKGRVRAGWGKLTDDHSTAMAGRREICAGRLQEAYGIGKEKAGRAAGANDQPTQEVADEDDAGLHRVDARQ